VNEPTWPSRHGAEVTEVLAGGDAAAIKQLYVRLGDHLEHDYGADVEEAPLLSLPETGPVVVELLRGTTGVLLDAGCGPNPAVGIALASAPGRSVVALDIGIGTVRLAVARAAREGVTLHGIVGDLEALPFRTDAFAGGVCDDTIEHLPDDARGAEELARVVAPRGRMVVATPNRRSAAVLRRKLVDRLRGRRRPASDYYVTESHLREYTWSEVGALLSAHFEIRRRASVGWSGDRARMWASRVVAVPGLRRVSRMVVVAAEPREAQRPS
jgi:SAM-dependent methyltransferase